MFEKRNWKVFCLGVSFFLAFGLVAFAQETGTITGTVMDPSGASIPEATVIAVSQATAIPTSTKTSSAGIYRIVNLTPGLYSVTVERQGFKTTTSKNVEVTVGAITRADVKMELGQKVEQITVEAGAPLISTEEGRTAKLVESREIETMALNGRNVFDLMRLAPGAVNVTGVMFENGAGTVVNGLRENFNGFIMNGVSNKGLSGGVVTQPNQDIVQEFQVSTLNLSAQYGNSAGAITNLVTKSGTNHLHGDAYEYFRNDKLDASDFFSNQAGQKKRKLRYNQFGGSVGGRLWKDKAFFFASFQGDRFVAGNAPTPIQEETPEFANAVINALPNSTAALLYKNFPGPSGTPFINTNDFVSQNYGSFGNLVCPDALADNFGASVSQTAPIASSFQRLFGVTSAEAAGCATPLTAGQSATQAANRLLPFEQASTATSSTQSLGNLFAGNEGSIRVDLVPNEKHRIFAQVYAVHTGDQFGPNNVTKVRGFGNPSTGDFPNAAAAWTWIITPTIVNELKGGYARNSTNVAVNVPGVPSIAFDTGDLGLGSYNGYPQFFHENIYTFADMISWTHGKHAVKVGVDIRRNQENSEFNVARPSYEFFDPIFFAADAPEEEVAGVDPGIIANKPAELATNNRAWRNLEWGVYMQDDWKVTSRLTLNLGLRYDTFSRHKEKFNRATQFIYGAGNNVTEQVRSANVPAGTPGCDSAREIALAQLAGICGPGGFAAATQLSTPDHDNLGPRFGFAYDPFGTGKTAIRGGFGLSYEGTLYNPLSNSRWNLPFYSFNIADNFLIADVSNIIYGPSTPGATPTFTGPATNIGQGVGAQAVGNLVGWDPSNANLAFLTAIPDPKGLQDPFVYNYFFGVQRQISSSLAVEVNYVGTSGRKLFRAQSVNRSSGGRLPIPGTCAAFYGSPAGPNVCSNRTAFNSPGRVDPNYGRLRVWENTTNSIYNSLQVGVTNKMKHGMAFDFHYTYGHSIDGGSDWHSGATSANGASPGDAFSADIANLKLDRGNSTFDIRHRIAANYTIELPWYKSQTGIGRALGGWSWSGLIAWQTGAHWSPFDSRPRSLKCSLPGSALDGTGANAAGGAKKCLAGGGTVINVGGDYNLDGANADRPDITGNPINGSQEDFANGFFANNPNGTSGLKSGLFKTPCLGCNGNSGRNTFVGPKLVNVDFSIFKSTKISERFNVQFRADLFNAFNKTNFQLPNAATGGNGAVKIQSAIFGKANGTFDPRQIQFSLKLSF